MTCAGDLNERVVIERRVKGENTRGEVVYTWEPVFPNGLWAQVNPLRGRDFFAAAQTQSEITTRFRLRFRTDIDETMRVVWRGRYYDIKGLPIEIGRDWLDLMCKAGPMDGR